MSDTVFFDETLQAYSQIRYDFNPKYLSMAEIIEIKKLAREKRADYGIAPIGRNIFDLIASKEKSLFFEKEPFDNNELDALIFMPSKYSDVSFIILNSNQPLLNQIFSAAHEYYHYLMDLDQIKKEPHICVLSKLENRSEQKASRFAAEFLLPDEALKILIDEWLSSIKKHRMIDAELEDIAILCYSITIRYEIPLKAVLFRLFEESYIDSRTFDLTLSNYDFLKKIFIKAQTRYSLRTKELISNDNPFIPEVIHDFIQNAFNNGFVSYDKLERDIQKLQINIDTLELDMDHMEEDDTADDEIYAELQNKLRKKLDED